ncbi:hypothetical protein EY01_15125, partial [Staphylococcus aureus]
RERQGAAQERAGQVLRRRHLAQEEAAGKAEGRQEAHEAGRFGGDPAGGLPGHPPGGRKINGYPNFAEQFCSDPVRPDG